MDALNTDGLFWILLMFTILKNLINTEEACKRLWSRFTYDAEEVGICFFERAQCLAYICREHRGNPFGVDQSTNADHFHVVHWWWESRAPSFSHNIWCLYTFIAQILHTDSKSREGNHILSCMLSAFCF